MSDIEDYPASKATDVIAELPENLMQGETVHMIRGLVRRSVLEAMRDQRYACVEAVIKRKVQQEWTLDNNFLDSLVGTIQNANVAVKS